MTGGVDFSRVGDSQFLPVVETIGISYRFSTPASTSPVVVIGSCNVEGIDFLFWIQLEDPEDIGLAIQLGVQGNRRICEQRGKKPKHYLAHFVTNVGTEKAPFLESLPLMT